METIQVNRDRDVHVRSRQPQALINGEWVNVEDIRVTYIRVPDDIPITVTFVFLDDGKANAEREMDALLKVARHRELGGSVPCEFWADPFETDPVGAVEPWHYLRVCLFCGGHWWGLHCPHDGHQNPCPHCDTRPITRTDGCYYPEDEDPA